MADKETVNRMLTIAKRLVERTREGAIQWSTAGSSSYIWTGTSSSVVVSRIARPNSIVFEITVSNQWGDEVEALRLLSNSNEMFEGASAVEMLKELFERARRTALDVDRVLDDVLNELK